MENLYYLATVPNPAPQSIPFGFGGHHDWGALDDAEKARRAWVRALPPACDPDFERIAVTFAQDTDGVWAASYAVMPGDLDRALTAALAQVGVRRDLERDRGVEVEVGGKTYRFHTDAASIANYASTFTFGKEAEADGGAGSFRTPWRAMGEYVPGGLSLADLKAVSQAAGVFVTLCFARAGAIEAVLKAKRKTETLRAALADEIGEGWPA